MTDTRKVTIDSLGHKGDGSATVDGKPYYFPGVLPGEEVSIVPNNSVGWQLSEIVSKSERRQTPTCVHFGICGGCSMQHMKQSDYIDWKRNGLLETLAQRGFDDIAVGPMTATQPNSRRRVVLSARVKQNKSVLGFKRYRSNDIEPITECPIALPEIERLLPHIKSLINVAGGASLEARITVNVTSTGSDVLVEPEKLRDLDVKSTARLAKGAASAKLARLSWGDDTIYQKRPPVVSFDGFDVAVPPGAFLQATEEVQNFLIESVVSNAQGAKKILDLFCGIGTFSLPLSKVGSVVAADSLGPQVDALNDARNKAGIGDKVIAQRRDLFRRPFQESELKKFDTVVMDPPRTGALDQSDQLARSTVKKIIYISCNPATFARDARVLVNGGFKLGHISPIDQFLWSPHTELCAVFDR